RLVRRQMLLGRRAFDFVGENQIGEDRPFLELELATLAGLHVDFCAGHIRRQQVRRELHARQIRREIFRWRFAPRVLASPGRLSISRLPLASNAISMLSTMRSWPSTDLPIRAFRSRK